MRARFHRFSLSMLLTFGLVVAVTFQASATDRIVFISTRDGNREIYLMDADGKRQVNLTQHGADDSNPVWSANGKQILFLSNRDGNYDIYSMDADGKNVGKPVRDFNFGLNRNPAWSKDGKRLSYVQGREGHIYVANGDGSQPIRIAPRAAARRLNWSPDGKQIVFERRVGLISEIHILDVTTKQIRRLILPPAVVHGGDTHPVWSPDGRRIAFARDSNVSRNIYLIHRDGSNLMRLTKGDEFKRNPAWSPDSKQILYEQRVGLEFQIFVIGANRANRKQLTQLGSNMWADWFDPAILAVDSRDKLAITWGELKLKP